MPLLGDPDHQDMVATLHRITQQVGKPSAIVVMSAHWECPRPTITAASAPQLIYDYSGFPPMAYDIAYPCSGNPALAHSVQQALINAGIDAELDAARGFDHGVFVPLKIMYPEADIPCVQVSLLHSLDAKAHIALGQALQNFSWDNLLVIGSGFSFHNMRAFFVPEADPDNVKNRAFDQWLQTTVTDTVLSETERAARLAHWEQAPHARFCHPRAEHLLPLHVCYGMAGKAADAAFSVTILRKQSSMFLWHC